MNVVPVPLCSTNPSIQFERPGKPTAELVQASDWRSGHFVWAVMTVDIHQPQMQWSMARPHKAAEIKVVGRPRALVTLQMGNGVTCSRCMENGILKCKRLRLFLPQDPRRSGPHEGRAVIR